MNFLKNVLKWVKSSFKWVSSRDNIRVGFKNLKIVLDVLEVAATLTDNKNDDKYIKDTKEKLEKLLSKLPYWVARETIENINKEDKGPMKNLKIGYDKSKGVHAGIEIKF